VTLQPSSTAHGHQDKLSQSAQCNTVHIAYLAAAKRSGASQGNNSQALVSHAYTVASTKFEKFMELWESNNLGFT